MAAESSVPLGTSTGGQAVRNLLVTTLINGVATPVLMQVIAISDQQGNMLDLPRESPLLQVLADIRRELMITNDLYAEEFSRTFDINIDIEKDYRGDKLYAQTQL